LHLISFRHARTRVRPAQVGDLEAELLMGFSVGAATPSSEAGEAFPVS
jgi:hypothetical protein